MNVVPLRQTFAADDIPSTLRRIADDIEEGQFGLRTTCVVVLGHTEEKMLADGDKVQGDAFEVFGAGPRCDIYTVRGLLLTAATQPAE